MQLCGERGSVFSLLQSLSILSETVVILALLFGGRKIYVVFLFLGTLMKPLSQLSLNDARGLHQHNLRVHHKY